VAPLPVIDCALDFSTHAKQPAKMAASTSPRLVLEKKFKCICQSAHLSDDCAQNKQITSFFSITFQGLCILLPTAI